MTNKTTYRQSINRIKKQIDFINKHNIELVQMSDINQLIIALGEIQDRIKEFHTVVKE